MPETPAGPQRDDPAVDEDLAELAALALVASGRAGGDVRDTALISAGDILLRRPDLEVEWRGLRETTAQLGALLGEEATAPAPVVPLAPRRSRGRVPALGWAAAAAAAAVVIAGGAGYALGDRSPAPLRAVPAPTVVVTAAPATLDVPGALVRSATDAATGARLSVRVVPAAGWVRLEATVSGVEAGRRCRLVAVPRSGAPVLAGSWLVSPKGALEGTGLQGTALVAPADLAAVRVEDDAGTVLVDARV